MEQYKHILLDELGDKIQDFVNDKNRVKRLMQHIQRYADSNSDILLTTDMSQRLIFSDADHKIIFTETRIDPNDVTRAIRKTDDIKSNWFTANNPFYVLSVLIMHYFIINKMQKEFDALTVYMSYLMYTSAHKGFFKYKPNKQVMDYTMNNLSNRFFIKQEGTIQGALEQTVVGAMNGRFMPEVTRCADVDTKDILSALETRISSLIKHIANDYYENHKSGKYMNHEDEDLSEENFHLSDNISFKINRLVSAVTSSIISEGFDQNTIVRRAIQLNSGASAKKLIPMLDTIIENDMSEISKMVSDILVLFIYKESLNSINDVRTMKFISESLQLYKSNAQNAEITRVKERLLKWIDISAEKYGRNFISRGKTSLDTYRRAIFTCFIFKIMECAK